MIKSTPLRISSPVSETLAFNPETSRITSPFAALVVVTAILETLLLPLLPKPRLLSRRREEEDRRLRGSRFCVEVDAIIIVCAPLLSRKSEEAEEVETEKEAVVMSVFGLRV
jgi:hypothetical protein